MVSMREAVAAANDGALAEAVDRLEEALSADPSVASSQQAERSLGDLGAVLVVLAEAGELLDAAFLDQDVDCRCSGDFEDAVLDAGHALSELRTYMVQKGAHRPVTRAGREVAAEMFRALAWADETVEQVRLAVCRDGR